MSIEWVGKLRESLAIHVENCPNCKGFEAVVDYRLYFGKVIRCSSCGETWDITRSQLELIPSTLDFCDLVDLVGRSVMGKEAQEVQKAQAQEKKFNSLIGSLEVE